MKIIFHGDDLGLTHSFNRGIFTACRDGLLRSTSIRTNGSAFQEAVDQLKDYPQLGVGLHLNIVEGPGIPSLTTNRGPLYRANGNYSFSFLKAMRLSHLPGLYRTLFADIERDFRAQIELALNAGIALDHLNSHRHSHIAPALFELTCKLAAEYKIRYVRHIWEPFHLGCPPRTYVLGLPWFIPNIAKHLCLKLYDDRNHRSADRHDIKTNDCFIGVLHTGRQTDDAIIAGLNACLEALPEDAIIEVLLHPASPDPEQHDTYIHPSIKRYVKHQARELEVDALCSPFLAQACKDLSLKPSNYSTV